MTLLDVVCMGAHRALSLHAEQRGIQVDPEIVAAPLRAEVATQYQALIKDVVAGEAAGGFGRMHEPLLMELVNTYCNLAAVNALRAAGYIMEEAA